MVKIRVNQRGAPGVCACVDVARRNKALAAAAMTRSAGVGYGCLSARGRDHWLAWVELRCRIWD
jgi:hypothetical protein